MIFKRVLWALLGAVVACAEPSAPRLGAPTTAQLDRIVSGASLVQLSPPGNLDQIDQAAVKLNGIYNCWTSCGSGVTVYIIDSGIRCTHHDLVGRCGGGVDFVGDGNGTADCFGHGTQMAGLAAGTFYGVAKFATLVPVRVLNCAGAPVIPNAVIIAITWVIVNGVRPGVINISLSGSRDQPTDDAIHAAQAAGFFVVAAAGNLYGQDACNSAGADAFTVGGTIFYSRRKVHNEIAIFSSVGPCVEIFAPGSSVVSDWFTSDDATFQANDGTSQATALASGAGALYLAEHPTANPQTVSDYLIATATVGILTNVPSGTANRFLRTNNGAP